MTESEIWQIIQSGNEISVMRTEVFITITVGVLIISSIDIIKMTRGLLAILLGTYIVFGYLNFTMLISEMEILLAGMQQLSDMSANAQEISYMGLFLVGQLELPTAQILIPGLHAAHWVVTISTVIYAVWRYKQQVSDT